MMKLLPLNYKTLYKITLFLLTAFVSVDAAEVKEADNAKLTTPSIAQLRSAAQNPLSPTYSLPLKYVYYGGANRGGVSVLSLQPVLPLTFGDWHIVNHFTLNFIDTPGGVTGIANLPNPYVKRPAIGPLGSTGLADLNLTSFITPAKHGDLTWGVGSTITMPSDAPSRELGSGKFSFGPAVAVVMQTPAWTVGLQGSQLWSVFGSEGRESVNQMQLKPLLNYNLDNGWYLVSNSVIVANWEKAMGQIWTVPIGGGIGRLFALGDYKINTRFEGYYNVARPNQAPDWSVGTTFQLMFPD